MKHPNLDQYRQIVKSRTKTASQLGGSLTFLSNLSEEIQKGKIDLKTNSVEFMVAKILNKRGDQIDLFRKGYFDLFVLGEFKKSFQPTIKVAEALASFYLEYQILPRLVPVPQAVALQSLERFSRTIENGVLIYERG